MLRNLVKSLILLASCQEDMIVSVDSTVTVRLTLPTYSIALLEY